MTLRAMPTALDFSPGAGGLAARLNEKCSWPGRVAHGSPLRAPTVPYVTVSVTPTFLSDPSELGHLAANNNDRIQPPGKWARADTACDLGSGGLSVLAGGSSHRHWPQANQKNWRSQAGRLGEAQLPPPTGTAVSQFSSDMGVPVREDLTSD